MSEQLQHDPRTKLQIKEALYSYLYQPVNEQFKHRLDTLIVKNAVINKYTHKSFMYKSELYTCDPAPAPRKMNRLHPSLVKEMDEIGRAHV